MNVPNVDTLKEVLVYHCKGKLNLWLDDYPNAINDTNSLFFFQRKTPSISYKILQMRVLYTNPCRDTIVPSYVDAHKLKKRRGRPLLDEG